MTETQTQTTIAELEEERDRLRQTEVDLVEEASSLPEKLGQAAENERGAWEAAAASGKKAKAGETASLMERREELPRHLWATRARLFEVSIELKHLLREQHENEARQAGEEAAAIRKRQSELQQELGHLAGRVDRARHHARELRAEATEEERTLARLRREGPDLDMFRKRKAGR